MKSFTPFSLNIKGQLVTFNRPAVMGIVNATPDSFYAGSRTPADMTDMIERRVEMMLEQQVDIIDLGAYSTRPGADDVSVEEELDRLSAAMACIRRQSADIPVSIDTFRSEVAFNAIGSMGADIINDISGGSLDPAMFETVASLRVPYVLMHMRGTPATMQSLTDYGNRGVTASVLDDLGEKLNRLSLLGVNDVIIDPGFGFAKTLEQNYSMMRNLEAFNVLGCPVLVGISRKSMLTRLLGIDSDSALNATTALNAFALDRGASILRVHDVKEARQAIEIFINLQ